MFMLQHAVQKACRSEQQADSSFPLVAVVVVVWGGCSHTDDAIRQDATKPVLTKARGYAGSTHPGIFSVM